MKCEVAQQKIALLVYGELADDEAHALEQHLASCTACQEEYGAVKALQQAMARSRRQEPSASLLAQARMRLEEALDNMPRNAWIVRARQSIHAGLAALGRAPVAASALLALGLGIGGFSGYRMAQRAPQAPASTAAASPTAPADAPIEVASVRSIVRDPNSENVEVQFNRLVPDSIRGSLDDPQIRQLLLLGAQSGLNPGVQQNSVSLLAEQCQTGHACSNGPVRTALLVALRYDKSPAVRLKALNGLEPYVAEDMHVRDSVLEALMSDPDPAVRSRAIELLQPVQADSSVQEVLHTVASEDTNPHIRTVSREVLDQLPEIQ
jgi:hypothetical protein